MLKEIEVSRKNKNYKLVKSLYKEVFPKSERYPFIILNLLSKRKMIEFTSYYDESVFVGFTYNIIYKSNVFVLYLGIDPKLQSKGYGSKILTLIKSKYKDKNIILNTEQVDKESSNYNQRVRRYNFYMKNGFINTNCTFNDTDGTIYSVLYTSSNFKKEEYEEIFKKFSFNLIRPQIKEVKLKKNN